MRVASAPQVLNVKANTAREAAAYVRPDPADMFLESSRTRFASARSNYHREMATQGLTRSAIGGMAGFALAQGTWWGPAAGAAIGLYTAWESLHREDSGTVTLHVDGETSSKPFYGNPKNFELTPRESHFQTLALGCQSGSLVRAYAPQAAQIPEPSSEQMAPWKDQAGAFKELGAQRRLVASFGQQTRDGLAAVHLIDSIAAAKLAACGGKVFLVSAQPPQNVDHRMALVAMNVSKSKANSEDYQFKERTVDYTLTALENPAQLAQVAAAAGVPEGMFGLLQDKTSYAEVLSYGDKQHVSSTYSPEFGTGAIRHSDQISGSTLTRLPENVNPQDMVRSTHHLNFPALLALAGTSAGLITASALGAHGAPALLGAAVGFLGGRAAGRALIDHTKPLGYKREVP